MSTLETLLKNAYLVPDTQPITLSVTTTTGQLRRQHPAFNGVEVTLKAAPTPGQRPTVRAAPVKRRTAKPARAAPAKQTAAPTQDTSARIRQAIGQGLHSPQALAQALGLNRHSLHNRLSRAVKAFAVECNPCSAPLLGC